MATLTAMWKTFYLLSYFILGSSFLIAFKTQILDINFDLAPAGFKTAMYGLSCFVLFIYGIRGLVSVMSGYEKYRKDKMENENFKIDLEKKINEHKIISKKQNL